MGDESPLVNIDLQPGLRLGQQYYPITVAARHSLRPRNVFVRWTTDHWQNTQTTACFFRRKHWDRILGSSPQSQSL